MEPETDLGSLVIDVRDRSGRRAEGRGAPWDRPLQQFAQALVRAVSLDDVAAAMAATERPWPGPAAPTLCSSISGLE